MSVKKTNSSKLEYIIIFVFISSFTIWGISKCRSTKRDYELESVQTQLEELKTKQNSLENNVVATEPAQSMESPTTNPPAPTIINEPTTSGDRVSNLPAPKPRNVSQSSTTGSSVLYVTIDNLNMREQPILNAPIVAKLRLFEAVNYLGETTEKVDAINLGKGVSKDPWVKIQTNTGKQGWVFGAGVHIYKKKNPLVK